MATSRRLALIMSANHPAASELRRGVESLGFQVLAPPQQIEQVVARLESRGEALQLLITLPGDERSLEEPGEIEDEEGARRHATALTTMMNKNAHAPIAITEALLARMAKGSRVIHIAPAEQGGPGVRMSRRTLLAKSRVLKATDAAAEIVVAAVCPAELHDLDVETTLWIAGGATLPEGCHAFSNRSCVD